ncbi:MAG: tRNA pseudouridine(55) synthase TruB [Alphaproteobacteria bacterium]
MAKRRKGSPVHGWVVVDKPEGVTSTQAVSRVKRAFGAQKAGHAGTLDPLATGVLAVALGEATKTVPFAMEADKVYRFVARFGEARDSDDAQGKVTGKSDRLPARGEILSVLPRFTGEILQTPPDYSAVRIGGERAYDIAREGAAPELSPRPVRIHLAKLLSMPALDLAEFELTCGKGAYVRAWVRDLARALGTLGHVVSLRRQRLGPFAAEQGISLEKLETLGHSPAALEHLLPIATVLDGIPALAVSGTDAVRLRSGNPVLLRAPQLERLAGDDTIGAAGADIQGRTVFLSTGRGEPVALAHVVRGELRPYRVFNFGAGL